MGGKGKPLGPRRHRGNRLTDRLDVIEDEERRLRPAKVAHRLRDLPVLNEPQPIPRHARVEHTAVIQLVYIGHAREEQSPFHGRDHLLSGGGLASAHHVRRPWGDIVPTSQVRQRILIGAPHVRNDPVGEIVSRPHPRIRMRPRDGILRIVGDIQPTIGNLQP